MLIEPLAGAHDRAGFDCGEPTLNEYLLRYARQNADKGVGRTFVATEEPGATEILGYYTLSAGSIDRKIVPESGLPRYPVPVAILGRLAIDVRAQGRGLGKVLLIDALRRCAQVSDQIAINAVVVDALNDSARQFYLHYGFIELLDDPLHLYLSIKKVKALGL